MQIVCMADRILFLGKIREVVPMLKMAAREHNTVAGMIRAKLH